MSRSRPKSVRKFRTSAVSHLAVAKAAACRTSRRVLRRLKAHVEPLGESILLRGEQARRLSEFQRWHVEYPALYLTDARTVICPEVESDFRQAHTDRGQPITSRILLEVAACSNLRRPRWAWRTRTVWYFIAWDDSGHLAHMTRCRTRKAALALFNRTAERLAVSSESGALIELPSPPSLTGQGGRHE